MRLIDIKRSINLAKESFKYKIGSGDGCYHIEGIQQIKVSLSELYKIDLLEEIKDPFIETIQSTDLDKLITNSSEHNRRLLLLDKIKYLIDNLAMWINGYVKDDDTETTVGIKLPQMNTLNDLTRYTTWMQKSLEQILPQYGGFVKFKKLEHGSDWVMIEVDRIETVLLIAGLVKSAHELLKTFLMYKETFLRMEGMALDNEGKKLELERSRESLEKEDIRIKAESVNVDFFSDSKYNKSIDSENERIGYIAKSLKDLVNLLGAGLEVHLSISAPREAQDSIPEYKTLKPTHIAGILSKNDDSGVDVNPEKEEDSE